MSLVSQQWVELFQTLRSRHENFDEYEAKFGAQLAKFNAHFSSVPISAAMDSLMLLENSEFDSSRRI